MSSRSKATRIVHHCVKLRGREAESPNPPHTGHAHGQREEGRRRVGRTTPLPKIHEGEEHRAEERDDCAQPVPVAVPTEIDQLWISIHADSDAEAPKDCAVAIILPSYSPDNTCDHAQLAPSAPSSRLLNCTTRKTSTTSSLRGASRTGARPDVSRST